MTEDQVALPVSTESEDRLSGKVARLTRAVFGDAVSNGERASLKRWAPGQPIPLAFYRVWLHLVADELPGEAVTPTWMFIAFALVNLGPKSHQPRRSLGWALADAGFTQARLERLLDAPSDVMPDLCSAAIRQLASKGESFDLSEVAELLLARSADARESIRRRIAAAFYRHQPKE